MKSLKLTWEIEIPDVNDEAVDLDAAAKAIADAAELNLLLDAIGEQCGVVFGDWKLTRTEDEKSQGSEGANRR